MRSMDRGAGIGVPEHIVELVLGHLVDPFQPALVPVSDQPEHLGFAHRGRDHRRGPAVTFRGDSHYGRAEAMAWCEENGVNYIFGLAGNSVLHRFAYDVADDLKVRRAEAGAEKMRSFDAFDYAAGSWNRERRVVARLEATARGFDARYIVTSLGGEPRHLYEDMESLVELDGAGELAVGESGGDLEIGVVQKVFGDPCISCRKLLPSSAV